MATFSGGTNANNSLTGVTFFHAAADADIAAISAAITGTNQQFFESACLSKSGKLIVPGRGFLTVGEGNVVFVNSRGWPILLSKDTVANGPWTT